jgi:hypothetical protein
MKSLFFTLDGHMVPASVNVSLTEMEIIMHLSKENVTNVRAQATKGLMYVKSVMGYKQLDPLLKN